MSEGIERRARFDLIRYANCWEDADILCEALRPEKGRRLLSIASSGDNTLALLAGGAEVVAADLSVAQLACVELRCAVFQHLTYAETLAILGVWASDERNVLYNRIRGDLSPAARSFWDDRKSVIESGVIHNGKFEDYFRLFRTRVLPLIHSQKLVRSLMEERNQSEREEFYARHWGNWRWRLCFRIFFSRAVMGRFGRDPEFFRYVEGSVSEKILGRAKYGLTVLPVHLNPYLEYIFTGEFCHALPRYLREENFEAVRAGLNRLTLHHGTVEDAAAKYGDGGWDGFNLSDIFEYVDDEIFRDIYGKLLASANPGARLVYWNMLVPRSCPACFAMRVEGLNELSRRLFMEDKAVFYSAFVVEEVKG